MNSVKRMRIITAGVSGLLVLAGFVSASHIVDTAGMLGLSGWYRFAAVGLIDFVAIVGKLSMHTDFLPGFRRSGFRLLMAGGLLSLAANVYAGHNLGEKGFGVLTVGVFMLLEHHITKAGRQSVAPKPTIPAAKEAWVVTEAEKAWRKSKGYDKRDAAGKAALTMQYRKRVRAEQAKQLAATGVTP